MMDVDLAGENAVTEPQWSNAVAALTFTDAAASRAGRFIADDGNARLRLRVLVEGGGCSGFQYRFRFDDGREDGDIEIFNAGVALVVDPVSAQYLAGAEIDYEEDLSGAQFVVRNPNADSTCGCGSSFSV